MGMLVTDFRSNDLLVRLALTRLLSKKEDADDKTTLREKNYVGLL